jgi:hypothetical protein
MRTGAENGGDDRVMALTDWTLAGAKKSSMATKRTPGR